MASNGLKKRLFCVVVLFFCGTVFCAGVQDSNIQMQLQKKYGPKFVSWVDSKHGITSLMFEVGDKNGNDINIVDFLLRQGAPVKAQDDKDKTVLHHAVIALAGAIINENNELTKERRKQRIVFLFNVISALSKVQDLNDIVDAKGNKASDYAQKWAAYFRKIGASRYAEKFENIHKRLTDIQDEYVLVEKEDAELADLEALIAASQSSPKIEFSPEEEAELAELEDGEELTTKLSPEDEALLQELESSIG